MNTTTGLLLIVIVLSLITISLIWLVFKKQITIIYLIYHYKKMIRKSKKLNKIEFYYFLENNNSDSGICSLVYRKFKLNIYGKKWVMRNTEMACMWWAIPPRYCYNEENGKDLMIDSINKRITILKKELWKL